MASAFDLRGKRILVTGAAGGIGGRDPRAPAPRWAPRWSLTDVRAEIAVAEPLRQAGTSVETHAVDVTDRAAVEAMVARAGVLDAVVANAGYVVWNEWDEEGWDDTFRAIMDVNVLGVFHLVRACLPAMMARRAGKIVIVTSVAGKVGGVRSGPHYVAAKGGLNAFVKWAARKAAPTGVLVNGVAPGPTVSPMTASQHFDTAGVPLGRMATADEIAWPIAFLCSAAGGLRLRLRARRERRHLHELSAGQGRRRRTGGIMRTEGIVVVTGGASGIGAACCVALAEAGRPRRRARPLGRTGERRSPRDIGGAAFACDVGDDVAMTACAARIEATVGPVAGAW